MNRQTKGFINGIIASVSYGTNPLFALPLYTAGIGTNSVLFYRYFFATIIYFLWLKFLKKVSLKVTKDAIFPLIILGLTFSLSSLTLFYAFKFIESGIACTILFIYPIMVALIMAIFFKEKITKTVICAIILTSLGIALLYKGDSGATLNLKGILLVLLSALSYAIYMVGIKKLPQIKHLRGDKLTFYVMLFGLSLFVVNLKFCTNLQILDRPFLWILVLCLAVIPTIISLETITLAIKFIGSTKTAILGALEPLTAIFFGILLFSEHLTLRKTTGILLILTGVILIIAKTTTTSQNK